MELEVAETPPAHTADAPSGDVAHAMLAAAGQDYVLAEEAALQQLQAVDAALAQMPSPIMPPAPETAAPIRRLDPCTLGRPFHRLDQWLPQWSQQLGQHLDFYFNRRYQSAFQLAGVQLADSRQVSRELGWCHYRNEVGAVAVRCERRVLLAMLQYRYGANPQHVEHASATETATERRFASMLGLSLLQPLRSSLQARSSMDNFTLAGHQAPEALLLRLQIDEAQLGMHGVVEFAFDHAWLGELLAQVAPERVAAPAEPSNSPLRDRLMIDLGARLATKQMQLGDVLRLRCGDVLPLRTPEGVDVLAGSQLLFRAQLAEHAGSVCLTTFDACD